MKKSVVLSVLLLLVLVSGALVQAQDATPAAEATQQYTQAELDANPYLKGLVARETTMVDTTQYKKDGPYKIALAAQGPTNSWAALFDEHARYHVAQLGPDVVSELLYADANGNADTQVPQVEDLLSQNPDALILVPMGRAALSASVDRAAAQGVPVVLCASGVDSESYVTEVGTNLFAGGESLANWLLGELGGKGKIVVMAGIPGVDTAEIQKQGADAVWAKNPDIEVLDTQYGQWSTSTAKTVMAQWLATYGDQIQGIWSGGGQMSMGIIEAYLEAKLPVPPIASTDFINGFLRLAKDNNVSFRAGQYPNAMVIQCIDEAIAILRGEPVPRFVDVRQHLEKTQDIGNAELGEFYNAKWNDDVFGPIFLPDEVMLELGYMTP